MIYSFLITGNSIISHCMKSVQVRIFCGPHFPTFVLNMERYSISPRIQSECGKIRIRKNSVFGHFSCSVQLYLVYPSAVLYKSLFSVVPFSSIKCRMWLLNIIYVWNNTFYLKILKRHISLVANFI